ELLLRLMTDGSVEALTGHADQGGGAFTTIQRVVSATMSIDLQRVHVRYGTTAEALRDPGAGGSHTTTMVGHAAIDGSLTLRDKLEELAAEAMGWPAGQVRVEGGELRVTGADAQGQAGTRDSELRAQVDGVARKIAAGP